MRATYLASLPPRRALQLILPAYARGRVDGHQIIEELAVGEEVLGINPCLMRKVVELMILQMSPEFEALLSQIDDLETKTDAEQLLRLSDLLFDPEDAPPLANWTADRPVPRVQFDAQFRREKSRTRLARLMHMLSVTVAREVERRIPEVLRDLPSVARDRSEDFLALAITLLTSVGVGLLDYEIGLRVLEEGPLCEEDAFRLARALEMDFDPNPESYEPHLVVSPQGRCSGQFRDPLPDELVLGCLLRKPLLAN